MSWADQQIDSLLQHELTSTYHHSDWLTLKGTQQMNINDVFPSSFLEASDLQGRKIKLEIGGVDIEELGGERKPILRFSGKDKGLVLNKTKSMTLAEAFGPETEGWAGREVALYPTKVSYNGKMVDSIALEIVHGDASASDVPF